MTNDKTVTMSRELAQSLLNSVEYLALRGDDIGESNVPVADELRTLLAAPVVERQEPKRPKWMDEPFARVARGEPPAPVSVVVPTDDHAEEAFEHSKFHGHDVFFAGFYACLDKVKELNQ